MNINTISSGNFGGTTHYIKKEIRKMQQQTNKNYNMSSSSVLPKEEPIERTYYISTAGDVIQSVKNKIQISIDNMTRGYVDGKDIK